MGTRRTTTLSPVTPSGRMSQTDQGTLVMLCLVSILTVIAGIVIYLHRRKKAKLPESQHDHHQHQYHTSIPVKKTYSRFSQVDEELTFCRQSAMDVDEDSISGVVELIRYTPAKEDPIREIPTEAPNSDIKREDHIRAPISQRPSYLETPL